ncbi:MAG TPA: hypothetical protein VGE59_02885 [Patescibacteria group bacterium]
MRTLLLLSGIAFVVLVIGGTIISDVLKRRRNAGLPRRRVLDPPVTPPEDISYACTVRLPDKREFTVRNKAGVIFTPNVPTEWEGNPFSHLHSEHEGAINNFSPEKVTQPAADIVVTAHYKEKKKPGPFEEVVVPKAPPRPSIPRHVDVIRAVNDLDIPPFLLKDPVRLEVKNGEFVYRDQFSQVAELRPGNTLVARAYPGLAGSTFSHWEVEGDMTLPPREEHVSPMSLTVQGNATLTAVWKELETPPAEEVPEAPQEPPPSPIEQVIEEMLPEQGISLEPPGETTPAEASAPEVSPESTEEEEPTQQPESGPQEEEPAAPPESAPVEAPVEEVTTAEEDDQPVAEEEAAPVTNPDAPASGKPGVRKLPAGAGIRKKQ